ncbi:MAG: helix-turn-helix transcriptional regulator [Anaerolineae bacterium]|nr:helix-turn-helix transcriptional regulator [Anaerolineae bacterium]
MTNAELVLLTLLAEERNHGYELEQLIAQRGMREWTEIGFSSIYYLLKKLEQEGLVKADIQPGGAGPVRKVYALTNTGHHAWQTASLAALANPGRSWSAFQLALSAYPLLPVVEAQQALAHYRTSQEERLKKIKARREAQQPLPPHVAALFDHSQALLIAEITWLDRYLRSLERNDKDEENRLQETG